LPFKTVTGKRLNFS